MVSVTQPARPEAPIIDAHLHVVSGDTRRYPQTPRGFGRDWWTGRTIDADAITADLDAAGVGRGVIVQAVGPYTADNRYARDAVRASGGRFALVAAIDADAGDPVDALEAVVREGDVAAVRVFAVQESSGWLHDHRAEAIWTAAADLGTSLVFAGLPHHLSRIAALCAATPQLTVALDHCAFVDLADGPPYVAAEPLFALAELPSVHLKVTTIGLETAETHGGAPAFVATLVERFGARRVAWGSDHPQTHEVAYPEMVEMARRATAPLDAGDARAVLHDTAARLWFGEG
jgi:L-fuconolactonase